MELRSYEFADALKQRFFTIRMGQAFILCTSFYGTDRIGGVQLARHVCTWRLRVMGPWIRSVIVYKYVYKGVIGWAILCLMQGWALFSWCRDFYSFKTMFWEADWRIMGGWCMRIGKDTTGGLEHFLYSGIVAALMIPNGAEPRYLFVLI
jgi:hypothetical protein